MDIKYLNELIDFCEKQELMEKPFIDMVSLYDQYCEYKFNEWMDLNSCNIK